MAACPCAAPLRAGGRGSVRILPHLQNTGGFFVAVFQKTAGISAAERRSVTADATPVPDEPEAMHEDGSPGACAAPRSGRAAPRGFREDPFIFLDRDQEPLASIDRAYTVKPSMPWELLFSRSESTRNSTVYIVSPLVKRILTAENIAQLRVINAGVKLFAQAAHAGQPSQFRLVQEGLYILRPHLPDDRILRITWDDLRALLRAEHVSLDAMSAGFRAARGAVNGDSAVVCLDPTAPGALSADRPRPRRVLYLCVWLGRTNVSLMIARSDRASLARGLFPASAATPA